MWDNSKINLQWARTLLAVSLIYTSRIQAAPDAEKLLSLPPAEADAKAKDYDHYFRVIVWPESINRMPTIIMRVYLSRRTANLPERGMILVTVRIPDGRDGKSFERARPLTEKEVTTICASFDGEEIFSLPQSKRSDDLSPPYGDDLASKSGLYFFVHIDKSHHLREEVSREIQASRPARRVAADIGKIVDNFLTELDKESGWADYREDKTK